MVPSIPGARVATGVTRNCLCLSPANRRCLSSRCERLSKVPGPRREEDCTEDAGLEVEEDREDTEPCLEAGVSGRLQLYLDSRFRRRRPLLTRLAKLPLREARNPSFKLLLPESAGELVTLS
jgi:hypothetical protein